MVIPSMMVLTLGLFLIYDECIVWLIKMMMTRDGEEG